MKDVHCFQLHEELHEDDVSLFKSFQVLYLYFSLCTLFTFSNSSSEWCNTDNNVDVLY